MLILVWIFTGVGIDVFFGQVGFAGWGQVPGTSEDSSTVGDSLHWAKSG